VTTPDSHSSAIAASDRIRAVDCVGLSIRKLSRAVTRLYDAALLPHGLTSGQFMLLAHVIETPRITMTQLARALGMDRSTLTRLSGPMQQAALITLAADKANHRLRRVEPTAAGRAAFDAAFADWSRTQSSVLDAFAAQGLTDLPDQLRRANAGIQALADPSEEERA